MFKEMRSHRFGWIWAALALQIAVATALGTARADEAVPVMQAPVETAAPAAHKTLTLSQDEQDALARGPVPLGRYIAGGIVGSVLVPFGVGQAIEGRYSQTGWIFTVTEAASLSAFIVGIEQSTFSCTDVSTNPYVISPNCTSNLTPLFWIGLASYIGFRAWEIVDLWVGPRHQNAAYRRAKSKRDADEQAWSPFLTPVNADALALGFQFRF